ncbi:MAG: hypothetical protein KDA25_12635, partial [Phycisphaerales bacterium]|nr:hypothetical protein [Phycisphaerales bacterium]
MSDRAPCELDALLQTHRPRLLAFFARESGPLLLRFETPEDLAQGVLAEALRSRDGFEYRDEATFLGWLFTIARRFLQARRDHWFAMKRNCGRVLRLTWTDGSRGVASSRTGPGTFAGRREQLVLVTRAIALLPARDRDLVRWTSEDVPLAEQAARLNIGYDAAAQARVRALDRLRKLCTVIGRGPAPSAG